jgi:Ca2+-binding EF-hand superfamily protein
MKTILVSFLLAGTPLSSVVLANSSEEGNVSRQGVSRSFEALWNAADGNRDGFITGEEFAKIPRIQGLPDEKRAGLFRRLDQDADGKLSRDELARLKQPREGQVPPLKWLWELDTDKSRGISFTEFQQGRMIQKLLPEKQAELFHRLDTDGDGVITPKDRPKPPHPDRPEADPKLDLNGDAALSFDEFRQGPAVKNLTEDEQEKRFLRLDRNGDHKISAEDTPPKPLPQEPAPPIIEKL